MVQVPKTENGLASRMGHLDGLDGVQSASDGGIHALRREPGRVCRAGARRSVQRWGARLCRHGCGSKVPVSSSLSLDGTINPDFGQVEVDPAVVNLTAFETFYEEKRPFFIEGANIFSNFGRGGANNFWGFNRADPMLFYSRRIGRAPQGSASGDFVEQPTSTTILGAAKLTGKTKKGWSLGTLDAVTGREWAKAVTGLEQTESEVEPLSNYFVGRAEKELGRRAAIGALGTAVNRDLRAPDLSAELPGAGLRRRHRRLLLPQFEARVGGERTDRGKPPDRQHRRDHRFTERVAAILRAARRDARRARSHGDVARRLDRKPQPESQRRGPPGQRRALVGQPRVRFERRRVHLRRRSRRHACRLSVAESEGEPLRAQPVPGAREVLHVELRPRTAGRRVFRDRQRGIEELLERLCERGTVPGYAGRSRHAGGTIHAQPLRGHRLHRRGKRRTQAGFDRRKRQLQPQRRWGLEPGTESQRALSSGGVARDFSRAPGSLAHHNLAQYVGHLRGSNRRRHLRIALRVLDAGSEGVQPSDPRELRDVAEDVAAGVYAAAGVGGSLHRVQAVRQAADLRLHPARRPSRQPDLRPGREALYRASPRTAALHSSSTTPTSTSSRCA